jgi:nicotinamidase-related amidase
VPAAAKNPDLHGSAPDSSPVALVLVDVINALDFEGGDRLIEPALSMAQALRELKRRCRAQGIPSIYLNDNLGRWREDQRTIVERCLAPQAPGRRVVEMLKPDAADYFVIKPKHSGFFATPLDTLLTYLRARTLILTGIGTELCILFTANDAFMRDYHLVVPSDCVTAIDPAEGGRALGRMRDVLDADIIGSAELALEELVDGRPARSG